LLKTKDGTFRNVQNEPKKKPILSVQCADSSPKTAVLETSPNCLIPNLSAAKGRSPALVRTSAKHPGRARFLAPLGMTHPRKNTKLREQSQQIAENKGHHFLQHVKRTQKEANFERPMRQFIPKGGDSQRLRRPALRKGFAFPGRATTLALRLRLRLKRRGVASPEAGWRDWRRPGKAEPFRKAEPQSRTYLAGKM
jgi:hypothetical protein